MNDNITNNDNVVVYTRQNEDATDDHHHNQQLGDDEPQESSNVPTPTLTSTQEEFEEYLEFNTNNEEVERRRLEKELEEKKVKRAKDRRQVEMEILSTERDYVNNLEMCYQCFIKPLKESLETSRSILKQDDYETMFNDIETIIPVNKEVLKSLQEFFAKQKELDERRKNGEVVVEDDKDDTLGKIFLRMSPYLRSYTSFCNKYDQIYKMYESLKESRKAFRKFLEKVEYQPEVKYQALPSFLILPVQRIPRYNLLLRVCVPSSNKQQLILMMIMIMIYIGIDKEYRS